MYKILCHQKREIVKKIYKNIERKKHKQIASHWYKFVQEFLKWKNRKSCQFRRMIWLRSSDFRGQNRSRTNIFDFGSIRCPFLKILRSWVFPYFRKKLLSNVWKMLWVTKNKKLDSKPSLIFEIFAKSRILINQSQNKLQIWILHIHICQKSNLLVHK